MPKLPFLQDIDQVKNKAILDLISQKNFRHLYMNANGSTEDVSGEQISATFFKERDTTPVFILQDKDLSTIDALISDQASSDTSSKKKKKVENEEAQKNNLKFKARQLLALDYYSSQTGELLSRGGSRVQELSTENGAMFVLLPEETFTQIIKTIAESEKRREEILSSFAKHRPIVKEEFDRLKREFPASNLKGEIGAEAIRSLLRNLDLEKLAQDLQEQMLDPAVSAATKKKTCQETQDC